MMIPAIPEKWAYRIGDRSDELRKIEAAIRARKSDLAVYPPADKIFSAMQVLAPEDVKVVLLGQDPYHRKGQAHGMAFSVEQGVPVPPSLANMQKELEDDLGIKAPGHGNLAGWAKQGVLLLNSILTVEEGSPLAHENIGWERITQDIINAMSCDPVPKVFILWGASAQKRGSKIDEKTHLVIKSVHPSPLSSYRGFFGSKPYSRANDYLIARGRDPVDWSLA